MSERERLINLLQNVPADFEGNRGVGTIADFLLSNGVIVPPVKVGSSDRYPKYTQIYSKNQKFKDMFIVLT